MLDHLIDPPVDKYADIDAQYEYAAQQYNSVIGNLDELVYLMQIQDMQRDQILEYANKMKLALEEALSVYE